MIEFIFAMVAILVIGVLGFRVVQGRQTSLMSDRLSTFTDSSASLEDLELQRPFNERVIQPMMRAVLGAAGKLSPTKNADKAKHNLEMAGNPNGLTATMFTGMRITLGVVMTLGFFVLTRLAAMEPSQQLMYTAVGGGIGFIMPGIWLDRKIKARKRGLFKALPDALDLLTICVEAGMGFDLALQRVGDKWTNELSNEFKRMISDTRLGIARRDAMRAMADRCSVPELSQFVSAILQAEQLGASFGKILKVQSEQMRIKRRQRAEELAHQAPIKMLFPMVFLIFPSIMVIILGPAVPAVMGNGVF